MQINSKEYWDNRFSSNDWEEYDGEGQSAYFADIALNSIPEWLSSEITHNNWSITDIGCAEGGGTVQIQKKYPMARVKGIDFSKSAIERAQNSHPHCDFEVGDIQKDFGLSDITFVSNVFEHLKQPREVLRNVLNNTRKHSILIHPYKDENGFDEHFQSFDESFFPLECEGFVISFFKIVDCKLRGVPFWPGKQILVVYSKMTEKTKERLLSDIYDNSEMDYFGERYWLMESKENSLLEEIQKSSDELVQKERNNKELQERLIKIEETLSQIDDAKQELQEKLNEAEKKLTDTCDELNKKIESSNEETAKCKKREDRYIIATEKICQTSNALVDEISTVSANMSYFVRAALIRLAEMGNSKTFKLLHFLYRFSKQGLSRNYEDRKKFRSWIKAHFSKTQSEELLNTSYNPLYPLVDILTKALNNNEAISTTFGLLKESMVPPVIIDDDSEQSLLLKHLAEQKCLLEESLNSYDSEETSKLKEIINRRNYKGILVYPHIVNWEPLQTPQQLLRAFAKNGWLCFFCEAPYSDQSVCREVENNLFITLEKDLIKAISEEEVVVLLTWMGNYSFVEKLKKPTIWYHILDHLEVFSYYDQYYKNLHDQTISSADVVSYVSLPLKEQYDLSEDAVYLPNGVCIDDIKKSITPGLIPDDLKEIVSKGKPIIGYYGYLAEWMDYDLVRFLAESRPQYEFVFIGKAIHDTSLIENLPNVSLLGLKPYKELFNYAKMFSVAIIPFKIDEKMECVSPIKFYEYLTLGKPVVSSYMPELNKYSNEHIFVFNAASSVEFLEGIDSAITKEVSEQAQKEAPVIGSQNAWEERARTIGMKIMDTPRMIVHDEYNCPDVIELSVIDFGFRHQRPQHLATRLAQNGHRVFYVNVNFAETSYVEQIGPRLYQVFLSNSGTLSIHLSDCADTLLLIDKQFSELIKTFGITDAVVKVDYPNWVKIAERLREKYGFKIITDYMDDYTGFLNPASELVGKNCRELLHESDAIVASSSFLESIAKKYNENVNISRNGTEYDYFHQAYLKKTSLNPGKTIGYYGAIAEWFDVDIVCYCAEKMPECDIVLVGAVTAGKEQLSAYNSIKLIGEVPYNELLPWLESFDVCIIPFNTSTDLIKATNPVKFYEYLSAGKKVVATRIPELEEYDGRFVLLENEPEKFCEAVKACFDNKDGLSDVEERFTFAMQNDWNVRTNDFERVFKEVYPKISIVVLCYNQLDYTKQCIYSVLKNTAYPNYELIIVDNNSVDSTAEYLKLLSSSYANIKIVLNKTNRGFAGGNNDGIKVSDGDYIVLLNNDTVVTRGWLTGLLKHYSYHDKVALVGPVTNAIHNEGKIPVDYDTINGVPSFALGYIQNHMGEEYDHHGILAMYCLMISRDFYDEAGPLDEKYGIGMFEDDDYCYAAKRGGYHVIMAEDVFIHHFGNTSFKKLENDEYMKLFNQNKKYFETKWNTKWSPGMLRPGV